MLKNVFITGAAGEVGQGLIAQLLDANVEQITCLDLQGKPDHIKDSRINWVQGSILDFPLVETLLVQKHYDSVFHFAALLSAGAAKNPELAHQVNIVASQKLLTLSARLATQNSQFTRFIFPSSMAVYGMSDKTRSDAVREPDCLAPITLYGKQKLEMEHEGATFISRFFDFRSVRFPGLISCDTVPVGGTSDYASLMAHASAQGRPYSCFVFEDSELSFLAMPDGISALIALAQAKTTELTQVSYNLHGFTISAKEISELTAADFPGAGISFDPVVERQEIVDSWPAVLDDSAARRDLNWQPQFDKISTFSSYLFPAIKSRYPKQFKAQHARQ